MRIILARIVFVIRFSKAVRSHRKKKRRRIKMKKDRRFLRGPEVHEEPLKYVKRHGPLWLPLLPLPFWNFFFFLLILYLRLSPPPPSQSSMNQDTETAGVPDTHDRSQISFSVVFDTRGKILARFLLLVSLLVSSLVSLIYI